MTYSWHNYANRYPCDAQTSRGVTSKGTADMKILTQKISGIYKIENTVNGHFYIGSAVNIYNRWKAHRSELRRGVHGNQILQRAWDKYGEAVFEFILLLQIEAKEDLIFSEQEFIDKLIPYYNILPTAGSNLGFIASTETRQKMSDAHSGAKNVMFGRVVSLETRQKIGAKSKGRIHSDEDRRKMSEAGKGNKYNSGHTASVETRMKMSEAHKGLIDGDKNPMYGKSGNKNQSTNKSVLQYAKSGELISNYLSTNEAARIVGTPRECISRCCKGKGKTAGGFTWRYMNEVPKCLSD